MATPHSARGFPVSLDLAAQSGLPSFTPRLLATLSASLVRPLGELLVRIGLDQAGVDALTPRAELEPRHDRPGEALAPYKAFGDAARDHSLEHMTEQVALPEPPVPVLGKGRMVGNPVGQVDAAEPAIRQVQDGLVAEPALGADPETIAKRGASGSSARGRPTAGRSSCRRAPGGGGRRRGQRTGRSTSAGDPPGHGPPARTRRTAPPAPPASAPSSRRPPARRRINQRLEPLTAIGVFQHNERDQTSDPTPAAWRTRRSTKSTAPRSVPYRPQTVGRAPLRRRTAPPASDPLRGCAGAEGQRRRRRRCGATCRSPEGPGRPSAWPGAAG